MTNTAVRKLLFTIVIDGKEDLPVSLSCLEDKFSADAKENATSNFGQTSRVQQIGFYRDPINQRGVFTGVAGARDLIEVTEAGQLQLVVEEDYLVEGDSYQAKVIAFVNWAMTQIGLPDAKCTWVVVPLDELGGGFGTLHIKGMGGISGNG